METVQLKSVARETNRRDSKHLTKEGLVPVVVYGHNTENTHLAIDEIEFEKILRHSGESTVIELTLPTGETKNVVIKDIQNHYLTTKPIHVDFYAVNMSEKLTANVVIEFIGESSAVKSLGGTLVTMTTEVEVECLPTDLPNHFEVDISPLKTFDDILTIKDIPHSDKVEILAEPDEPIAKVQEPRDLEAELAEPEIDEAEAVAAVAGEDGEEGEADAKEGDKSEDDSKEEKSSDNE